VPDPKRETRARCKSAKDQGKRCPSPKETPRAWQSEDFRREGMEKCFYREDANWKKNQNNNLEERSDSLYGRCNHPDIIMKEKQAHGGVAEGRRGRGQTFWMGKHRLYILPGKGVFPDQAGAPQPGAGKKSLLKRILV